MSDIPGLGEGIEAVRVMMQGTEIFLRLTGHATGWTIDRVARAAVLLAHHMEKKKSEMKKGEISFRDLITRSNGGVNMMQIENDHFEDFEAYAKKMGLSYSIMPDINKSDIYMEIAFPEDQGEAFRYFISQNPEYAKNYTYGEYFDNANPVDMEEEIKGFGKEAVEYAEELKQRENYIAMPFDESLLKESEFEGRVLVAIPNTENEYALIYDNQITKLDGNYSLHMYANTEYYIVDDEEKPVYENGECKTITGEEYKHAITDMQKNTELNKKKREAAKGSVKFVRRDEAGKLEERIVKPAEQAPVEKLEELLDRAKGR